VTHNITVQKFKIIVAYEGTQYHGWQVQQHVPTIAQTMRERYARVFKDEIKLIGVSRTDTGVHARGQVAVCTIQRPLTARALQFAWNNVLPQDIRIVDCSEVDLQYNPFHAIDYKEYHYHILSAQALPFYVRYGWHLKRPLDYQQVQDALQRFVGTHNFRSFSTGDDRGDDTIRTIHSIAIEPLPAFAAHRIIIRGPYFLRYMIRRMVGAAIDITLDKKRHPDEITQALINPNTRQRFFNAPACGLTLHNIVYTHDHSERNQHEEKFFI
jgi:tRNA pseudouridine38-40 synthase